MCSRKSPMRLTEVFVCLLTMHTPKEGTHLYYMFSKTCLGLADTKQEACKQICAENAFTHAASQVIISLSGRKHVM